MAVPLPSPYRLTTDSSLTEETGVAVDMTDDGASAVRDLYAKSQFQIDAVFAPMWAADNAALLAFLRSNRLQEIDVALDGVVYRCRIVRPLSVKFVGGLYRQASVQLRGYAL